jgi:hypothetical protein
MNVLVGWILSLAELLAIFEDVLFLPLALSRILFGLALTESLRASSPVLEC